MNIKKKKNITKHYVLLVLCILYACISSCNKTEPETLLQLNSVTATSEFNSLENSLTLTLTDTEFIYGLQYKVINNQNAPITINSFIVSPTYNLYKNTCHTHSVSNNVGLCFVSSSNITESISSSGMIKIIMNLEPSNEANITDLILVNKNSEIHPLSITH